jgi:hypothetical protein
MDQLEYRNMEIFSEFEKIPESERYGFLLNALEKAVERETDKNFLKIMAVSFQQLFDMAIKKSGAEIIHPGNRTIN